jgi:hypothetical protein
MKPISRKKIAYALRSLGLREITGNGTGHEVWGDALGNRFHPVLRKKDMHPANVRILANELVSRNVLQSQAEFTRLLTA